MKGAVAVVAIVLAGLGMSSTAFAGEVIGSGDNGKGPLGERPGRSGNPPQNWGQIPKELRPVGIGCNGNLSGRK